jgi:hypothetical protein
MPKLRKCPLNRAQRPDLARLPRPVPPHARCATPCGLEYLLYAHPAPMCLDLTPYSVTFAPRRVAVAGLRIGRSSMLDQSRTKKSRAPYCIYALSVLPNFYMLPEQIPTTPMVQLDINAPQFRGCGSQRVRSTAPDHLF